MGQEIVYCYKCQRRIVGAEFAKGQAYQVGDRASCSACAAELLHTLEPKEREGLLAQMFKSTRERQSTSSAALRAATPASSSRLTLPAQLPIVPARGPSIGGMPPAALWLGLGAAATAIVLLFVVFSGGKPSVPEEPAQTSKPRAVPAPPRESTPETRRQDEAATALRKAREYDKARPDDLSGQIKSWQEAVWAADKTPHFDEAQRELAAHVARRRELVAKGLSELEEQVRPKLAAEEYKAASEIYQSARSRYDAVEWTGGIEQKVLEIHQRAIELAATLREKALAAQMRKDPAEVKTLLERVARWGYPEVELEFRRAIEAAVPPPVEPPRGPLSRWLLSEGKGATAADTSGLLKATLKGSAGWAPASPGSSIHLDGSGAHVELPNTPELDRLQVGSYSVSIWFKPDALPKDPNEKSWGGAFALVMKAPFREGLLYIAGGHFILVHWLDGSKWTSTGSWSDTSEPGAWYHVTGVVDRAAGEDRLYVNGQLKGTESWAKNSPGQESWSERWILGKVNFYKQDLYLARGSFADLRFYDRVLEAAEIAALHSAGRGAGK